MSRQDRARAVLALLSRLMRPAGLGELSRLSGLDYHALHMATYYHPWFSKGGGVIWVTEAGWRERLAGHPDLKE